MSRSSVRWIALLVVVAAAGILLSRASPGPRAGGVEQRFLRELRNAYPAEAPEARKTRRFTLRAAAGEAPQIDARAGGEFGIEWTINGHAWGGHDGGSLAGEFDRLDAALRRFPPLPALPERSGPAMEGPTGTAFGVSVLERT